MSRETGDANRIHYSDATMTAMESQIVGVTIVYRLFRCRSKKTSNLRVTDLCDGDSPGTGEFPAQRASNTENISIWWRHHVNEGAYLTRISYLLAMELRIPDIRERLRDSRILDMKAIQRVRQCVTAMSYGMSVMVLQINNATVCLTFCTNWHLLIRHFCRQWLNQELP